MATDIENTHRDIVEQCKQGNRKAQYRLYSLYSKAMYNTCLRMLGHEAEAEDLLQRSFLDVFTKLHTFRYESSVGAWIKRVVINNCINHLKKRRLEIEELEEGRNYGRSELPAYVLETPDYPVSVACVKRAIETLPDGYRVVLSMYLLEGFDHEEIAKYLDISVSTSKSQYSRAKKKLREIVAATEEV